LRALTSRSNRSVSSLTFSLSWASTRATAPLAPCSPADVLFAAIGDYLGKTIYTRSDIAMELRNTPCHRSSRGSLLFEPPRVETLGRCAGVFTRRLAYRPRYRLGTGSTRVDHGSDSFLKTNSTTCAIRQAAMAVPSHRKND